MIENIEEVSAKREFESFRQRKSLLQIQVGVEVSRSAKRIASIGIKIRGSCEAARGKARRIGVRAARPKRLRSSGRRFVENGAEESAIHGQVVGCKRAFLCSIDDAERETSSIRRYRQVAIRR